MATSNYRSRIVKIATFLGGLYFVIHFFTPSVLNYIGILKDHDSITLGFAVIGSAAIGLGIINIIMVHGSRIMFVRQGWQYSAALLIGFFSMLIVTALDWRASQIVNHKTASLQVQADCSAKSGAEEESKKYTMLSIEEGQKAKDIYESGTVHKLYQFLFDGLFTPLSAAMFSLLSVYIAAAAFRAFRIRTFEAFLMMASAVIVMLGQTSFGVAIYEGMPNIRQWLMEVPNSAAFRAIRIGAAIAGLVMAVRVWLSIDSKEIK